MHAIWKYYCTFAGEKINLSIKMKRILAFFLLLSVVVTLSARQHITFQGIPLTEHIDSFAEQLDSQGIALHPSNVYTPAGQRLFIADFFDKKADVLVNFSPKTSTVYSVQVRLYDNDLAVLDSLVGVVDSIIPEHYAPIKHEKLMTKKGAEVSRYLVYADSVATIPMGKIYVGTSKSNVRFYSHMLSINIEDTYNKALNNKEAAEVKLEEAERQVEAAKEQEAE